MDQMLALLMGLFFLATGVVCIGKTGPLILSVVTFFRRAHQNEQIMENWENKILVVYLVKFLGFLALLNFTVQLAVLVK